MAKISSNDLLIFTKHLSVMLNSGIPLSDALVTLSSDNHNRAISSIVKQLADRVSEGHKLSEAMKTLPHLFNGLYLNLIRVGEESGKLDSTLAHLSQELGKLHSLRKKIKSALLYPGVVLSTMLVIGVGISLFVLPQLAGFFSAFEQKLPWSTQLLLSLSLFMKNSGPQFFLSIFILFLLFILFVRYTPAKKVWDRSIFHLPIIGEFIRTSRIAELSRNLSILLGSGMPLPQGLASLIEGESNTYLHSSLQVLLLGLNKGKQISATITAERLKIFPLLFVKMVGVGEKTGKLDEMLAYLADYYDEEIDSLTKNLSTILEPILLVVIGLMVGFLALAIIGPIYQITGSIGR